jgi:hypothetical protein
MRHCRISNREDFHHPWLPWEYSVSPDTVYIGVERTIIFPSPFRTKPDVTLGLSTIDLPPMDSVLARLGYRPPAPEDQERIRHLHIATSAANITPSEFEIQVGIGLPTAAARVLEISLAKPLTSSPSDTAFIATMRRYNQLEDRAGGQLTPGETWLINFYRYVGSLAVTWMAQAPEQRAK